MVAPSPSSPGCTNGGTHFIRSSGGGEAEHTLPTPSEDGSSLACCTEVKRRKRSRSHGAGCDAGVEACGGGCVASARGLAGKLVPISGFGLEDSPVAVPELRSLPLFGERGGVSRLGGCREDGGAGIFCDIADVRANREALDCNGFDEEEEAGPVAGEGGAGVVGGGGGTGGGGGGGDSTPMGDTSNGDAAAAVRTAASAAVAPPDVSARNKARLNTFGPFHGSATCLEEMRAQSPPRSSSGSKCGSSGLGVSPSASSTSRSGAASNGSVGSGLPVDAQYLAWIAKHPSALASFNKLTDLIGGRQLAVFLDYDGTLSPIVEDPDRAFMPDGMRAVVKEVAAHFPTAIISGRGRDKVYNFVRLSELYYAGSHGMDIMLPLDHQHCQPHQRQQQQQQQQQQGKPKGEAQIQETGQLSTPDVPAAATNGPSTNRPAAAGDCGTTDEQQRGATVPTVVIADGASAVDEVSAVVSALTMDGCDGTAAAAADELPAEFNAHEVVLFQPAREFAPLMDQVFHELQERSKHIKGAGVENNRFCLTVHFRRVPEEHWEELADIVADIVNRHSKLRTTHGRKVLEIRPVVDWDKGKAVAYLLQTLGLGDCAHYMPLYIGDDRTDEDAFQVLNERGSGCGIVVAAAAKSTKATFSLRDPHEVMQFLHKLVVWKEQKGKPVLSAQ